MVDKTTAIGAANEEEALPVAVTTAKVEAPKEVKPAGAVDGTYSSENFTIKVESPTGIQIAKVALRGWVGPEGLVFPLTRTKELSDLLATLGK